MRARFDAEGDVIVVTGGANGIGLALARAAAQEGAGLVGLFSEPREIGTDNSEKKKLITKTERVNWW
jgi:NAD(P)-dependent dehydrogenase (short-subunit alcohol dehydrogenase family)